MKEIDAAVQRALLNGQPQPQSDIRWVELGVGTDEQGQPIVQKFPADVAAVMVALEAVNILRQIAALLAEK